MNSPHSCRRHARLPAALALVLALTALAGCGNKGPLVLPEDAEPAQAVAAPAAQTASDASVDAPVEAAPVEAAPLEAPATDTPPADTPDPPRAHD